MTAAPELHEIPRRSLDEHLAILGIAGAGKTYAAKGAVEQLLDERRRVCVIDPTGVWWGLRLTAGGEASDYPVVIFGGDRADVPIDGGSGERLAELVAQGSFSCVIDVLRMTVSDRTRFFAAFAEALARFNRRPLHLVIDEAHLFAPQGGAVQDLQSARMVGAANHLVSGGRALGLRVMLISQRPAKVHKDSLTQVSTLVAMRVISPQDRKAVKDWIGEWADRTVGDEVLASLPSMKTGEGWIWAPTQELLARASFRLISTFDSSATPDADSDAPPAQLGAVPIEELRAALQADSAEDGAPAETGRAGRRASAKELEEAEARGFQRGLAEGRRLEWSRWMDEAHRRNQVALDQVMAELRAEREAQAGRDPAAPAEPPAPPAVESSPRRVRPMREASAAGAPAAELGASAKKLLQVLQAPNLPAECRAWSDVALLAVLAPTGGSFNTARKQLLDSRLVVDGGKAGLLPVGKQGIGSPLDAAAIVSEWCEKLGGSARRILSTLYVKAATKAELAAELDLAPTGGSWNNAWKLLRRAGVVEECDGGRWHMAAPLRALKRGRS